MPPTVLAQPNGSSIFFRRFWDNAYPSCRVVRPSIAEYLDFWAMWGVTQAWRRSDTLSPSLPADLAALITPAGALALLRLDVYGPASRLPILSRIAEITGHLARLLHGGLNDVQGEPYGCLFIALGTAEPAKLAQVISALSTIFVGLEVLGYVPGDV